MDIKEAARKTIWLLNDSTSTPVSPERREEEPNRVEHILWLLKGIESGYIEHEKAHRWLGWAQSALYSNFEHIKLSDLKHINKSA